MRQVTHHKSAALSADHIFFKKHIAIIIPTYKPGKTTLDLLDTLSTHYPSVKVIVINDSIPKRTKEHKIFTQIEFRAAKSAQITCLRTIQNSHKSGALNLGIDHVLSWKRIPDVILTCDDDIGINQHTLPQMVETLFSKDDIGAVCSRSLVKNKHKNILTRLQGLEYFGFTITKIADNNFMHGPLVMQGMLTAFRSETLAKVNGFALHHLIEDYDITARVKRAGWKVAIAKDAQAWTDVPENLASLWKQRVRWGYWGIIVVKDHIGFLPAILQDLIGHTTFTTLLSLIIISLVFYQPESMQSVWVQVIVFLSLLQFLFSYVFGLVTMFFYEDRDKKDWILRLTILPELLYSNVITMVLLGCYIYLLYNVAVRYLIRPFTVLHRPYQAGLKGFARVGYVEHWGTRAQKGEL